eukprot:CAMPEP_0181215730 /NCGR_PEP_ID=MMETSP1096-20121128/26175_1 /TAXON_ID=156174 ORGANISM="Chrysochromulina ericina, Strain CCMP281" /NCGR_SAMPLE_ID=MMETSP1096 /ASSEMBLY_ACC=CAM_ASM_000453 /LENGTH=69 /DNA_ID=CAMNT_0023307617 /DNA_START=765 /DNA_END=970 /DNA_ORIENTATION=-
MQPQRRASNVDGKGRPCGGQSRRAVVPLQLVVLQRTPSVLPHARDARPLLHHPQSPRAKEANRPLDCVA